MTEAALTPDTYAPSVGDNGKYFDSPSSIRFEKNSPGIKCGCGSKKVFKNKQGLTQHWARAIHRKWLVMLDSESKNHFKELQKANEALKLQQRMIACKDKRIRELEQTISTITIEQNALNDVPTTDLLDFD
jgi:hypothetical protein